MTCTILHPQLHLVSQHPADQLLACGRNIFILGFALYMGLSIPNYFSNFGPTVTTTDGTTSGPLIKDGQGNPLSCRNPNLFPVSTGNNSFNGAQSGYLTVVPRHGILHQSSTEHMCKC